MKREGDRRVEELERYKSAAEAQLTLYGNTQLVMLGHMDLMTQATLANPTPYTTNAFVVALICVCNGLLSSYFGSRRCMKTKGAISPQR